MATEERIKEMAYGIWEQEGCPEGKDREHYFHAKEILEQQEAIVTEPSSSPAVTQPAADPAMIESPPRKKRRGLMRLGRSRK